MDAKHTPGPWMAGIRLTGGQLPIEQETNASMHVAMVNGRAGEQEANACLIAAAPELLEALQECEAMLDKAYDRAPAMGTAQREYEKTMRTARAAIAKATGTDT